MGIAFGPAFVEEERDLTPAGLTKPGYVGSDADLGPGVVVVLIPAHNEEALIGEALKSLAAQTRIADEVIVIADNCTDKTSPIAIAHEAVAVVSYGNGDKKAGALNQTLARVLPRLSDNDSVLIMDADTSLSPDFISNATHALRKPEGDGTRVGAVGGIFLGYPLKGLLAHLQNNEYVRYAREIGRRKGRADVLTGTASLFSVRALRDVLRARETGQLPPSTGVCDVKALTEDNELTLALKHLGYRCVSPRECTAGTELMPSAGRLFHQRLRWQRGALENLLVYGLTHSTLPYILRQLMTYIAVAFVPFFVTALAYQWTTTGTVGWSWFWLAVTGFVAFERVWAAKRGGWRAVLLAAAVVPELLYDLMLHVVYIKSLTDLVTNARQTWDYAAASKRGGRGSWNDRRNRIAGGVYATIFVAAPALLALACVSAGIAWLMIAAFVLGGATTAVLRLTMSDPLGPILGTGELSVADYTIVAAPQGFGGFDVTADTGWKTRIPCRQPPAALSAATSISPAAIRSSVSQSTTNRVKPQTLHAHR
jgi:cellulose synthase/poly-beta-1,6-N-acetylglucosamine synthase-like glycosyltransferase